MDFLEELIDPHGQRERRLVQRVNLKAFRLRFARLGLAIALALLRVRGAIFRLKKRIDALGPLLAVLVQQMVPAHLAGDDLVAVRVVDEALEEFHVLLGLAVLLLEEPLPIVFVPNFFRLVGVGHMRLV